MRARRASLKSGADTSRGLERRIWLSLSMRPGPAVSITNAIGVARRAPHPHAALLFYDYVIGAEGQRMLAKIGYVPTHPKIESPVKGVKLKFLDAAALLDEQEKSFGLFEQIILKGRAR